MSEITLPSREEYTNSIKSQMPDIHKLWSDPKYICPKCKEGGMRENEMKILAVMPPKNEYKCDKCGYIDYI